MKRTVILLMLVILKICLFINNTNSQQQNDTLLQYSIEEVKIEAFRSMSLLKELPYNVQIISKQNLSSITHNDIGQILKKVVNIDIIDYQGIESNIGMRGFVPTSGEPYVKILINGIPAGTKNIASINTYNASQIEILKGPFSSFYGSGAMGGIINIVTKENSGKIGGSIYGTIGSYETHELNANIGGNISSKINFDAYISYNDQNKPYKTGNNNLLKLNNYERQIIEEKSYNKTYNNTEYKKYNIGVRLGYNNNKKLKLNFYNDIFYVPHTFMNGTFWGIYGQQKKSINRINNNIILEKNINNHNLRFIPYYSIEKNEIYNNNSDTAFISDKNSILNYGIILQDEYIFNKNKIIIGLENNTKEYTSERWENKTNRSYPYLPNYVNSYTGLYAQINISQMKKLKISIGNRIDYIIFKIVPTDYLNVTKSKDNYITINPNITIKYNLLQYLNIHASAGKAFLAPDAFKKTGKYSYNSMWGTFNYKGNNDLKPEKSWTIDGGLSLNMNNIFANLTIFNTWHRNLIVSYTIPPDTTSYKNSNNSIMNGIEVSTTINAFATQNFKIFGFLNGTYMFKSKVKIDSQWYPIRYVRNKTLSTGLTFEYKNISTTISARYSGERYEDNWLYTFDWNTFEKVPYKTINGEDIRKDLINEDIIKYPDFVTFDFNLNYELKKFIIKFNIENIFNENYAEKDMYYMPGRFVKIALGYHF